MFACLHPKDTRLVSAQVVHTSRLFRVYSVVYAIYHAMMLQLLCCRFGDEVEIEDFHRKNEKCFVLALRCLPAQPAEPRSGWAKEPPDERAVELARTISSRRYLDGGVETEDLAILLVEAAGSLSMHTSVRLCANSQHTPVPRLPFLFRGMFGFLSPLPDVP